MNCQRVFDEPPPYAGPAIRANTTIAAVKSLHLLNAYERITDDLIIAAVVVGNDRQDNIYKTLMIQDSTGGISLKMDGYSLFSQYPIGQQVFVRLKGLWMSDYGGMIQIGASMDRTNAAQPTLQGIPQPLFARVIIKGKVLQDPQPRDLTMGELHDSLQGMLIRLNQVEFAVGDTAKTYADVNNQVTISHSLRSCGSGTVYVRTSAFAAFAKAKTPRGHGSITGLYSIFRTQKQILLRDTSEVQLNGLRCSVGGPVVLLQANFNTVPKDTVFHLDHWQQVTEAGHRPFMMRSVGGKSFAEISAFATREPSVISWLILPSIDLDHTSNEVLRFTTKDGFDNGAVLQVLVSTNYDGNGMPWKARWTALNAQLSKGNINAHAKDWLKSGDISLHAFKGKISIAFRYEGSDPPVQHAKQTSTFRIADIEVWGN
jgi:hypothetical protein